MRSRPGSRKWLFFTTGEGARRAALGVNARLGSGEACEAPVSTQNFYDLIVLLASSHVTGLLRKYDSLAMWQATAA